MIVWKVKSSSTWSKLEEGYLGDYRIATIETIYDHQFNRTVRSVMVRFFIGSETLYCEAPDWYVAPDWSCEVYQHKIKRHHQLKKRFDNFASGDYKECYDWVIERLEIFLQKTGLQHGIPTKTP